jgi:hypothetical protein
MLGGTHLSNIQPLKIEPLRYLTYAINHSISQSIESSSERLHLTSPQPFISIDTNDAAAVAFPNVILELI